MNADSLLGISVAITIGALSISVSISFACRQIIEAIECIVQEDEAMSKDELDCLRRQLAAIMRYLKEQGFVPKETK